MVSLAGMYVFFPARSFIQADFLERSYLKMDAHLRASRQPNRMNSEVEIGMME